MATKAEIVAELKKYSEYNDIKDTVLMRELKATLDERLAKVKDLTLQEVDTTVVKPIKKSTRKSTAKIDFFDAELDMDLLNDETIINDFYGDDFEEVDENDFPS